jgi:hypothetical protein
MPSTISTPYQCIRNPNSSMAVRLTLINQNHSNLALIIIILAWKCQYIRIARITFKVYNIG